MRGFIAVLYESVDLLTIRLIGYRLYWVIDFINETCIDLLENYSAILTAREKLVCRKLSNAKFIKSLKNPQMQVSLLRRHIAMYLYEIFKICRKLNLEDKQIVIENFNLNRIES